MSLQPGNPPSESRTALAADLPRFASNQPESAAILNGTLSILNGPDAQGLLPHEIYAIELQDVRNGGGLQSARSIGWRYLLPGALNAPLAADVQSTGGGHRLSVLDRGIFPRHTVSALETLQQDGRVQAQDFVLRLLIFPAARFRSIWLKAVARPDYRDDLFYPLNDPARPSGDVPTDVMSYEQFEPMLSALARGIDVRNPDEGRR
jgi:hypothetical protein